MGVISVSVRMGIGFERLKLYVTSHRVIVAHESRKGRGALAVAPLLGKYGGLDEPKGRDRPAGKAKFEALSPERILASDRDNFALGYDELVSVELREGSGTTDLVLLTGAEKFQFSTSLGLEEVAGLLAAHLGDRLTTRRLRA